MWNRNLLEWDSTHQKSTDGFSTITTVPFEPGNGLDFVISNNSWHGVESLVKSEPNLNTTNFNNTNLNQLPYPRDSLQMAIYPILPKGFLQQFQARGFEVTTTSIINSLIYNFFIKNTAI